MAGIGFELKRLFQKKGLLAMGRAYSYAGMICAGPMLLGVVLLLGVMFLCEHFHMAGHPRDLLVSMITYTLLGSLMTTSFFSMVVTRFIADMIYEQKLETIMPSFWGSTGLLLVVGSVLYGLFLSVSGITVEQQFLCLMLFGEMIVIWNAMSYLTAIKDYRGLLISFAMAVVVAFLLCFVLMSMGYISVETVLFSVCVGYGVMLCWDVVLLQRYFPQSKVSAYLFLRWVDRFLKLGFAGLFVHIGLFSHLVIMWASDIGVQVQGLFYGAPQHDVPALVAFLTILITTINFVVSVEVNFYPKYRDYCAMYNDKGNVQDIMQTQGEMLDVLRTQLLYMAVKQLCVTAISIALCKAVLGALPLGFNDQMYGYFRTLSVGYGLYAIGNTLMLLLLYFTDYNGALFATAVFGVTATLASLVSLAFHPAFYGVGFLIGAAAFYLVAMLRLNWFIKRLPYHILGRQPIVEEDKSGAFGRLGAFLEKKEQDEDSGEGEKA